jgi:hypothetical protein
MKKLTYSINKIFTANLVLFTRKLRGCRAANWTELVIGFYWGTTLHAVSQSICTINSGVKSAIKVFANLSITPKSRVKHKFR